jgi:putative AlgH/UPF0301 family transcriptional regulator
MSLKKLLIVAARIEEPLKSRPDPLVLGGPLAKEDQLYLYADGTKEVAALTPEQKRLLQDQSQHHDYW